ncbi:helix-turn-helix domain-containing protein [Leifsonia kafniensis]
MITLPELLSDTELQRLHLLAGDPSDIEIEQIGFVEELDSLEPSDQRRLLVAGHGCSRSFATDDLLDVTLLALSSYGVTALVLTGALPALRLGQSTRRLAHRLGLAVYTSPESLSTPELLGRLTSALAGDAEHALLSIEGFINALQVDLGQTDAELPEIPELLEIASRTLNRPVEFRSPDQVGHGRPVHVDGLIVGVVTAPSEPGNAAVVAELVTTVLALVIERTLHEQGRRQRGTAPGRDAVLSELLVATDDHAVRLINQARELDVPIDGWHRAFMLLPPPVTEPWSPEFLIGLGQIAVQATRQEHRWLLARSEGALILIETWGRDPRPTDSGLSQANAILGALAIHFPAMALRCGIGTAHNAVTGLRASVAECRVALNRSRGPRIAQYDAAGMRPIIVELANAGAARVAVRELLQPLIALGGAKATQAIFTLQTYLDEHGSLARTAERLNLHRNSVAYRVRQARDLLEVDIGDPDQRLALQLACRAYLLTMVPE